MSGAKFEITKNMESIRHSIRHHRSIVGLKWKKLDENSASDLENSPVTRSMTRKNTLSERQNGIVHQQSGMLRRAMSVRDAFGSLRQKLRVSTRRKKRLVNADSPLACMGRTPASQRKMRQDMDVKMYSPFSIDTPGTRRTPRAIKMGLHQPKRFNFSSPGQVQRDVNALAADIQALHTNTSELERAITGTTPCRSRGGQPPSSTPKRSSPRRAAIFV